MRLTNRLSVLGLILLLELFHLADSFCQFQGSLHILVLLIANLVNFIDALLVERLLRSVL